VVCHCIYPRRSEERRTSSKGRRPVKPPYQSRVIGNGFEPPAVHFGLVPRFARGASTPGYRLRLIDFEGPEVAGQPESVVSVTEIKPDWLDKSWGHDFLGLLCPWMDTECRQSLDEALRQLCHPLGLRTGKDTDSARASLFSCPPSASLSSRRAPTWTQSRAAQPYLLSRGGREVKHLGLLLARPPP
jgi:hypothetical protein